MYKIFSFTTYDRADPETLNRLCYETYQQRLLLDKLEALELASRKGVPDCKSEIDAEKIRKYYSIDTVMDISKFDSKDSLYVKITPYIDDNGRVTFDRYMQLGNKKIRDKYMETTIRAIADELRTYIFGLVSHRQYVSRRSR